MRFLIILCITAAINNLSFSQINTEKFRMDSDSVGLTGIVDIDITAITGNTDLQFINLGGRLNYNWGESYTFFVADGGFGWDDGERIFDQALLHVRHVHSISELIQAEAFAQIDFNKSRLLTERELLGGGLRLRVMKSENIKLRVAASYFYEVERYDVPENCVHGKNLFANRISTYFTFEYEIKDDIKLISITYYQPQIGKLDDFRILSDNSLIIKLSSFVDLKTSFNLRYDAKPPETIKGTDTFTKFGFTFKF